MSLSLNLAQSQFRAAATQAVEHSERTYPQFINGQMFRLATYAIEETERADDARVGWALGQIATTIRTRRKDGARIKGRLIYSDSENTLAARIINKRLRDKGEPTIHGKELAKAVRRLIGARVRSTEFIRSGWVPGARLLARAVGYAPKVPTRPPKGKPKGSGRVAIRAFNSIVDAELVNTALLAKSSPRTGSRKGNPMPVARKGLDLAYRRTAKNILEHLANKLRPEFAKVSAR